MPAPHRPQPPGFFSRGTCDLSGQINFNALANWTELYFASWYVNAKEPEVMSNFMRLYPKQNISNGKKTFIVSFSHIKKIQNKFFLPNQSKICINTPGGVSNLFPALGEEFFDQPSTSRVLCEGHTACHYHLSVNQKPKGFILLMNLSQHS